MIESEEAMGDFKVEADHASEALCPRHNESRKPAMVVPTSN
jgi:hypothetical protein